MHTVNWSLFKDLTKAYNTEIPKNDDINIVVQNLTKNKRRSKSNNTKKTHNPKGKSRYRGGILIAKKQSKKTKKH